MLINAATNTKQAMCIIKPKNMLIIEIRATSNHIKLSCQKKKCQKCYNLLIVDNVILQWQITFPSILVTTSLFSLLCISAMMITIITIIFFEHFQHHILRWWYFYISCNIICFWYFGFIFFTNWWWNKLSFCHSLLYFICHWAFYM